MKRSDLRKVNVRIRDKDGNKTYDYIGYFHQWIYSEDKYPLAIVEKEDGSVCKIDYNYINFLPDPVENTFTSKMIVNEGGRLEMKQKGNKKDGTG